MPLRLPIRQRRHHVKRPVDPVDRKLSRSVLALILAAILVAIGIVLIVVSSNPGEDEVTTLSELIPGIIILVAGVILGAVAICFYRKFYVIKKQKDKDTKKHGTTETHPPTNGTQNGPNVTVISTGVTPISAPDESYVDIDIDDNSSFSDGFERGGRQKRFNDFVGDIDDNGSTERKHADWNASTMKLNEQAMRIRHTPPSPEPTRDDPSTPATTTIELDGEYGDYAEISDYDYFADQSHLGQELDMTDITSDVVSFKSAQEELSTPPPERIDIVDGAASKQRRSVHFNDDIGSGVENIAYERRNSEDLSCWKP